MITLPRILAAVLSGFLLHKNACIAALAFDLPFNYGLSLVLFFIHLIINVSADTGDGYLWIYTCMVVSSQSFSKAGAQEWVSMLNLISVDLFTVTILLNIMNIFDLSFFFFSDLILILALNQLGYILSHLIYQLVRISS